MHEVTAHEFWVSSPLVIGGDFQKQRTRRADAVRIEVQARGRLVNSRAWPPKHSNWREVPLSRREGDPRRAQPPRAGGRRRPRVPEQPLRVRSVFVVDAPSELMALMLRSGRADAGAGCGAAYVRLHDLEEPAFALPRGVLEEETIRPLLRRVSEPLPEWGSRPAGSGQWHGHGDRGRSGLAAACLRRRGAAKR